MLLYVLALHQCILVILIELLHFDVRLLLVRLAILAILHAKVFPVVHSIQDSPCSVHCLFWVVSELECLCFGGLLGLASNHNSSSCMNYFLLRWDFFVVLIEVEELNVISFFLDIDFLFAL